MIEVIMIVGVPAAVYYFVTSFLLNNPLDREEDLVKAYKTRLSAHVLQFKAGEDKPTLDDLNRYLDKYAGLGPERQAAADRWGSDTVFRYWSAAEVRLETEDPQFVYKVNGAKNRILSRETKSDPWGEFKSMWLLIVIVMSLVVLVAANS